MTELQLDELLNKWASARIAVSAEYTDGAEELILSNPDGADTLASGLDDADEVLQVVDRTRLPEAEVASEARLPHSEDSELFREVTEVICLSHLRWGFVFQRPQHLLSRFARTHRVFFV